MVKGKFKNVKLSDTDLWGLCSALQHGLQTGYFADNANNEAWAKAMYETLNEARNQGKK